MQQPIQQHAAPIIPDRHEPPAGTEIDVRDVPQRRRRSGPVRERFPRVGVDEAQRVFFHLGRDGENLPVVVEPERVGARCQRHDGFERRPR